MSNDLLKVRGIGKTAAKKLISAGYGTIESVADSTPQELAFVKGIGVISAEKIIKAAKHLINFERGLSIVLDSIKKNFEKSCPKCGGEMQKRFIILGPNRRLSANQCKLCKFYMPN